MVFHSLHEDPHAKTVEKRKVCYRIYLFIWCDGASGHVIIICHHFFSSTGHAGYSQYLCQNQRYTVASSRLASITHPLR